MALSNEYDLPVDSIQHLSLPISTAQTCFRTPSTLRPTKLVVLGLEIAFNAVPMFRTTCAVTALRVLMLTGSVVASGRIPAASHVAAMGLGLVSLTPLRKLAIIHNSCCGSPPNMIRTVFAIYNAALYVSSHHCNTVTTTPLTLYGYPP